MKKLVWNCPLFTGLRKERPCSRERLCHCDLVARNTKVVSWEQGKVPRHPRWGQFALCSCKVVGVAKGTLPTAIDPSDQRAG